MSARAPYAVGARRARHVRPALPHDRVGRPAGQGAAAQRHLARRRPRRRRVDLPGGPPRGAARLHLGGRRRVDGPLPRARVRVRPVHGLRGVPALADRRVPPARRRQRPRRVARPPAHGPHHHVGGAAHRHRLRRLRRRRHPHHQGDGRGSRRGRRHRRDPRADAARARDDDGARPVELVGARADCVASTTASGSRSDRRRQRRTDSTACWTRPAAIPSCGGR